MRSLKHLILLLLVLNNFLLLSQKLDKPNSINIQDFDISNFNRATVLYNNTLVTFPYKIDYGEAGALDKLFSLRIEGVIRLCLPKNEAMESIAIIPVIYGQEPTINSIMLYYQTGNSITTEKIKTKDLEVFQDSIYYYCSLSNIGSTNNTVIDLFYTCNTPLNQAKEKITFRLIRNLVYKDFNVQVIIPEIYYYTDLLNEPLVTIEVGKNYKGPLIGYWNPFGGPHLTCKALMESFKKAFGARYEEVYCSQNLTSIRLKSAYRGIVVDSDKEIVSLKLMGINEIR